MALLTSAASVPPGTARIELAAGGETVQAACGREEIVAVAVDGGRMRFLAALEPDVFEQTPAFGPSWPLARGHTLSGGWISARGITAFSGLGIHGPARARWRLDSPARRFEAVVAIDDSAGQGGSVVIRILEQDRDGRWSEAFASGLLRGGEEPLGVGRLDRGIGDLHDATGIEIVVDSADRGDVLDRTVWLDPLVISAPAPDLGPRP